MKSRVSQFLPAITFSLLGRELIASTPPRPVERDVLLDGGNGVRRRALGDGWATAAAEG